MPKLYQFILVAILVLTSGSALAYVGPGAGLSVLGSTIGLLAAIGLAVAMVLVYPIKLLFKRRGRKSARVTQENRAG